MQNFRVMTLEEQMLTRDSLSGPVENNFIIIRHPETGKILQRRDNLVVRSGRELNLRKIFNIAYPTQTSAQLGSRSINCFSIGTGGTPVADPFNPIPPTPVDTKLNSEVFFRSFNSANPITPALRSVYKDPRVSAGDTNYFKKAFTSSEIIIDPASDQVYAKLMLEVNPSDARNRLISELALFSSIDDGAGNLSDFKIATRVTFKTEPLDDIVNKGLAIEYYVYA